ncbi:MAG: ribonuclease HII [Oscillospiraceae bacterium]|nr:ribonuclease HII [Oscillospiraceae bacterium]MBR5361886.1 ribonuclease HII [Oscillospiraceae bacterium]
MPRALKVYTELFEFDSAIRTEYPVFCGIDEAGRGPLAGDVYAAAVILPEGLEIPGLNDSKKLSEKRREELAPIIKEQAAAWCIASASVAEIEALNILQAALLAMQRAVAGLKTQPVFAITDGNQAPVLPMPVQTVIGGDAKSASIAAASVLAKTARDAALRELDAQYPQYGFAAHKGYGTKAHYEAIDQYGICPAHRPSFLKKYYERKGQ